MGAQEERNAAAATVEMVGVIVVKWGRRWRKQEGGVLQKICLLVRSSWWRANVCAIRVLEEIGRAWHAQNGATRGGGAGE
jgi:hypothetical protein